MKDYYYDAIIIGAGPSGMTAAIYAAGGPGRLAGLQEAGDSRRILLLDQMEMMGKKILVTGNGRCNLTNLSQKPAYYHSDSPDQAWQIICHFDEKAVRGLMRSLGVCTKDREGYVYPYNEQAACVREAFEAGITGSDCIDFRGGETVKELKWRKKEDCFQVRSQSAGGQVDYFGTSLVIATGGLAGPGTQYRGDGYSFAQAFGHQIVQPHPALTALCSPAPFLKKLSGVRCRARIFLLAEDKLLKTEEGELQWTSYGISGIAVFSLSRYAICHMEKGERILARIDFMPDWPEDKLCRLLEEFGASCPDRSCRLLVNGLVAAKLSPVILKEAAIREDQRAATLSPEEKARLCRVLKDFPLRISGYKSYDKAQVTMGGVDLSGLTGQMESRLRPGLFFAGEVTDVDGTCGGYNLQWAFSSGKAAGDGVAAYLRKKKNRHDSNISAETAN